MSEYPIDWEFIKVEGAADFLVGRTREMIAGVPTVILSGHVDTVLPARGMQIDGDTVSGSGVNDMKGGIVSMLEAVRQLHEEGQLKNIILALSPEEEIATPNHRQTICSLAKEGAYVMVFEANQAITGNETTYTSGQWELTNARKGAIVYEITYSGPGGHSGEIENLVERKSTSIPTAKTLIGIEELANYDLRTTLNPGKVNIGENGAVNILASDASILGEARFWNISERDRVKAGLTGLVKSVLKSHPGITGKIEYKGEFPPMDMNSATEAFSKLTIAIANEIGISVTVTKRAGSSEANFFAEGNPGIAVLDGFGVWGKDEHRVTETASLKSLSDSIGLAKAIIRRLQEKD